MEEIFEKIKQFAAKQASISNKNLNRQTRVEQDLGVTGDDAIEFIIAFGKEFNVDISRFKFENHFRPEGIDVIGIIGTLFGKKKITKRHLTLGNLEEAVIVGIL